MLGSNITKFTNDFLRLHDTSVGHVTTVSAPDFGQHKITAETKCFVCEEALEGTCAQVKRVIPVLSPKEIWFAHPKCFSCAQLSEASVDGCCGAPVERVIPAGTAPHNKDGKEPLHLVHLSDGLPVCPNHISKRRLEVPAFDPETQGKEIRRYIGLYGFAKVKTKMTEDQAAAEYERVPLAAGMINGVDEKSMRAKMLESNWDSRMDWCDKERGLFGLVCDSKAKEGMPDEINKLLKNGIRADPILSMEAFTVRAATTDSLLPCFPPDCNAQGNIMTDLAPYVLIPKE